MRTFFYKIAEKYFFVSYICLLVLAFLPFTSANSSLVLSLSIFSFQSLDRSFSMHEDSEKEENSKRHLDFYFQFFFLHSIFLYMALWVENKSPFFYSVDVINLLT